MFLVSFISAFLVPSSNDCFSFSIAIFLVNSRVPVPSGATFYQHPRCRYRYTRESTPPCIQNHGLPTQL